MSRLRLNLAELAVESFPTAPEGRRPDNALMSAVVHSTDEPFCDTFNDCSTYCIVPTNICRACNRLSDHPDNC